MVPANNKKRGTLFEKMCFTSPCNKGAKMIPISPEIFRGVIPYPDKPILKKNSTAKISQSTTTKIPANMALNMTLRRSTELLSCIDLYEVLTGVSVGTINLMG